MDNVSITENNNLRISETPNAHVQGDPNVFINSNIVKITDDISISVGSTETLPPDSNAYVVNAGDNKNVILDFGLVRGQNGIDGVDGIDGTDGTDGFSPIATVTQTEDGASISITDATQTTTANITNGTDGTDGFSPIATVTRNSDSATIEITDENGTTSATVYDGISPTATVTPTPSGADITITSASGTTTASVTNGTDGTDGTDGFSPIATVTQTASGATISITDQQGTTTANITNGVDGTDGTDGTDGFSPIANVSQSGGTTTISITDQQGTTTASITVPTQFSDLTGTIDTNQISNGAVTPAKLSRGVLSLPYYSTSVVTVTTSAYSALTSGTITTYGGNLHVTGNIYGVKTGGGTVGLLVKIDNNTPVRVSMHNLQGNAPLTCDYLFTGISAGTHTISYAVAMQSGSSNSYVVNAYCEGGLTFVEL